MQIETVEIVSLKLDPKNARRHERGVPELAASLEAFGQRKNLVVWRDVVISGNGLLLAAQSLGWDEVEIDRVPDEWTYEKAQAYALADNRTAELSEWDFPVLEEIRFELDANGWDTTQFGFEPLKPPVFFGNTDPDDVPDVPEVPRSKLGDLYQLGEHRVLCGDSTSTRDVARLMGGALADLLWTDPPYGVSYADKNAYLNAVAPANRIQVPIEGDHQSPSDMSEFWKLAFATVRPHLKPGASYYVTGPQGGDLLLLLLLLLALTASGFPLRHMIIWAKNNFVLGRSDYNYQHEPVIYGWVKGTHKFYGGGGETSLWLIDKPQASKLHPTMKPVALVERSLANSTRQGAVVLDPFGGSGSTLIGCETSGRVSRTMEIDPGYTDVTLKRWENLTGKKAKKLR